MNHTITTEAFGTRIRPVRMEDAPFLVWLRNLDHAKGKVGDSAADVASQEEWLRAYFARDNDYYFIVESLCGTPMGSFGIYDSTGESAEFGRWIIGAKAPGAVASMIMAMDTGFDVLGFRELRTKVASINHRVIAAERKVGFKETQFEPSVQMIGGVPTHLIHMAIQLEDWPLMRTKLRPIAAMMAMSIPKWERNLQPKFS